MRIGGSRAARLSTSEGPGAETTFSRSPSYRPARGSTRAQQSHSLGGYTVLCVGSSGTGVGVVLGLGQPIRMLVGGGVRLRGHHFTTFTAYGGLPQGGVFCFGVVDFETMIRCALRWASG